MLHIIGMILKIIGLIAAGILGLLVLLVLIVLFVPLRYEITASLPGRPADIEAKIRFSWLCHLVSGRICYDKGKAHWRFRVFWRKIGEETERKTVNAKKTVKKKRIEEKVEEEKERKKEERSEKSEKRIEKKAVKEEIGKPKTQKAELKIDVSKEERKPKKKRRSVFTKIKEKIKGFFEKIKYTFRQICDKIKMIEKKKDAFTAYLEDEAHRLALARMRKETVWIKRFLKPKKLRMDIHFGLGDPYRTGQALALLSMIYPFTGEYMAIEPDFEEKILEGEIFVKGCMRLSHIAILLMKLLIDRNVRTLFWDTRKLLGI